MANAPDVDNNIANLKSTVRKSFARVYAALKARELKTLRQLDAIHKQCQDNKDLARNCVQNIHISYENESTLLDIVSNFAVIDFEKLNFDSTTFTLEDYVTPNDDHMYSYKTIELSNEEEKDLEAIEEAALKEVIRTENCVCFVNICSEEVSKKFRELDPNISPVIEPVGNGLGTEAKKTECLGNAAEDEKSNKSDEDAKKIEPTDEWLNSIKGQTETEPTQVTDVMEHSTIACT